jgi:hypothetical protein
MLSGHPQTCRLWLQNKPSLWFDWGAWSGIIRLPWNCMQAIRFHPCGAYEAQIGVNARLTENKWRQFWKREICYA